MPLRLQFFGLALFLASVVLTRAEDVYDYDSAEDYDRNDETTEENYDGAGDHETTDETSQGMLCYF
jgi:hypothetical protein